MREFDLCHQDSHVGTRQQLLDVPAVLQPAGMKLQQDEVRGRDHRHEHARDEQGLRAGHRIRLPRPSSHDEIHVALAGLGDANHAEQRVFGVPVPNRDADRPVLRQRRPRFRLQRRRRGCEQVEIEGGPRNAMSGERTGSDERVRHAAAFEDRRDPGDQRLRAHGSSPRAARLGSRPVCRRPRRSRWPSSRETAPAAQKMSRSSSASRAVSATRSPGRESQRAFAERDAQPLGHRCHAPSIERPRRRRPPGDWPPGDCPHRDSRRAILTPSCARRQKPGVPAGPGACFVPATRRVAGAPSSPSPPLPHSAAT